MSRFWQYVMFLTEPDHTTYSNLDFHYQMMDTFSSALAKFHVLSWFIFWQHIPHSRRLSIDKIPTLGRPALQQFNCNVPDSGHTWPDQTRVSLRSPGGGKMRDPGKEAVSWPARKHATHHHIEPSCTALHGAALHHIHGAPPKLDSTTLPFLNSRTCASDHRKNLI